MSSYVSAVIKKESIAQQKPRMRQILDVLSVEYPAATIQLHFENCFELMVATILSAQCTDTRVNIVTKALFERYRSPEEYAGAVTEELEQYIFSTGFYKAKAKNIKAAAKKIIEEFGRKVPRTMDELLTIPGVGRKTANVILGHCFDVPGIVVDTHVIRISNLLGFVDNRDPQKIEFKLMKIIPKQQWVAFTHYFIHHGRNTCKARRPLCHECKIAHLCPSRDYYLKII